MNKVNKLLSLIEKDAIILTPNHRLGLHLQKQIDQEELNVGKMFWPSNKILSFDTWIKNLWNNLFDKKILLNPYQENVLWEETIKNYYEQFEEKQFSYNIAKLIPFAKSAKEAFDILNNWDIAISELQQFVKANIILSKEIITFIEWVHKFNDTLNKHEFIVTSALTKIISQAIKNNRINKLPKKIILVGFEQITFSPMQKNLLHALTTKNCSITEFDFNTIKAKINRVNFFTQKEEITAMAYWAKKILDSNPIATIGCIIPNLTTTRPLIERIFIEVFNSNLSLYKQINDYSQIATLPFNFSAGKKLNDYKIINIALNILKLGTNILDIDIIQSLLTSSFLNGANIEFFHRVALARKLQNNFDTKNILYKIASTPADCAILKKNITKYQQTLSDSKNFFLPSIWSTIFATLLQDLGWPGDTTLTSVEFQIVERWNKLLNEFATLDLILKELNFSNAIKKLEKMAAQIIFQPKAENKQINILGILEASGINFDYIWLGGMNNNNFPSSVKPNPFLPIKLQQKLNMPHAKAIKELEFSKALFQRITQSAKEVIVSFAKQDQNIECQPSPLIKKISEINLNDSDLNNSSKLNTLIYQSSNLEKFLDSKAPLISENENISGTADILKLQALCPFQAFATYRLHAKNKVDNNKFLRGELTHKALELIWKKLQHQSKLLVMSDGELKEFISSTIDIAIREISITKKYNLKINFNKIEKKCLERLLYEWLEFEKSRQDFEVVDIEKTNITSFGGLKLKLRSDRIDKEADGSYLIIDYKTSKVSPSVNKWYGDRPEEPQLPLYCITANEKIDGIGFATLNLKEKNKKIKSKTRKEDEEAWEQLLQEWSKVLTNLATKFYEGDAVIDPKNIPETCDKCNLALLCRKKINIL